MVGEMRDMETIEIALTAAETGHLVLSTLHTIDAMETVNRIVSVFPPLPAKADKDTIGGRHKGHYLPEVTADKDGKGRVPAIEVLVSTSRVRECIEDKEKTRRFPTPYPRATRRTECRPSTNLSFTSCIKI